MVSGTGGKQRGVDRSYAALDLEGHLGWFMQRIGSSPIRAKAAQAVSSVVSSRDTRNNSWTTSRQSARGIIGQISLRRAGTWLEEPWVVSQGASRSMISRKQLEEIAATVQGVPVFGCLPGSTGAEAGARYGDIVLGVNGVRTPGIAEYLAARALRSDGIELRLLRAGQELTLFVEFRPVEERMESLAGQIVDGRYLGLSDLPEGSGKGLPS